MDLFQRYGLTRVINACGKMTHLAGAIVLPEIAAGNPTIVLRAHHIDEGYVNIDAIELTGDEIELICQRIRQFFRNAEA